MKRVTFLWLWVCALLWGAGVQVWGAPVTFVVDGYKYIVRSGESQRVTLSAIPRGVKDIVIPSSVQHEGVDYSVVWIGGDAISLHPSIRFRFRPRWKVSVMKSMLSTIATSWRK